MDVPAALNLRPVAHGRWRRRQAQPGGLLVVGRLDQGVDGACGVGLLVVQPLHRGQRTVLCPQAAAARRSAVASISMRMRGSSSCAEIIMAAGRTSPRWRRSTGQHLGNWLPSGNT